MVNNGLTATSPLNGYVGTFSDTHVREISSLAIVSVTVPRDGLEAINGRLNELWHISFPETGQCVRTDDTLLASGTTALILYGLQSDQCFLVAEVIDTHTQDFIEHVHSQLGSVAYLTDQSDSWAVLDVSGPLSLAAMERICMLDMTSMKPSQVARTTMEHLSVIVERPDSQRVRLFSPRSSALSFLHAVTTSVHNVDAM